MRCLYQGGVLDHYRSLRLYSFIAVFTKGRTEEKSLRMSAPLA
jgi:hypothetical protein